MENIKHLIQVLKSQVTLYQELLELMSLERESIITWRVSDTVEINKKKEDILKRERIQGEARNALLLKLSAASGITNMTLTKTINWTQDPNDKETLIGLGDKLLGLVSKIHEENLSLRILYTSNNRLLNDFFKELGMQNTSSYNSGSQKINTYHKMA